VSADPKIAVKPPTAKFPVRPRAVKLDIVEAHKAIAARFPQVLAELAK
jgi:hypothetical protein